MTILPMLPDSETSQIAVVNWRTVRHKAAYILSLFGIGICATFYFIFLLRRSMKITVKQNKIIFKFPNNTFYFYAAQVVKQHGRVSD